MAMRSTSSWKRRYEKLRASCGSGRVELVIALTASMAVLERPIQEISEGKASTLYITS